MTEGTPAPTREIGDDSGAEIAERARHQVRIAALSLPAAVVGVVLLRFDPAGWSVGAWMTAVGVGLALGLFCWLVDGSAPGGTSPPPCRGRCWC